MLATIFKNIRLATLLIAAVLGVIAPVSAVNAAVFVDSYRYLTAAGGGSTYIASVQQVSITIAAGATSGTATISSVDTSRTFLVYQNFTNTNTGGVPNETLARIELTNATTVTAYRNTSDAVFTVTVNATVVEGTSSLVDSVEYGTVSISSSTGTATISSVDTSRSAVFLLGNTTTASATTPNGRNAAVTLTNATTVTANIGVSSITGTAGFVVVQFNSSAIQSVQRFTTAYTSSSTTDDQTISSVTTGNTMLVWGGTVNASDTNGIYTLSLLNSTTARLTRQGTGTGSRSPYYTVVEFASGVINSRQAGTIQMQSVTSNTATISAVDTSRTVCGWMGWSLGYVNGAEPSYWVRQTLTDSTTVTATTNTSSGDNKPVGYQCVEFN